MFVNNLKQAKKPLSPCASNAQTLSGFFRGLSSILAATVETSRRQPVVKLDTAGQQAFRLGTRCGAWCGNTLYCTGKMET